jgi:hypothetical protein
MLATFQCKWLRKGGEISMLLELTPTHGDQEEPPIGLTSENKNSDQGRLFSYTPSVSNKVSL